MGEVNNPTPKPCRVFHLTHSDSFATVFGGLLITAATFGSCDIEEVRGGPQALEVLEGVLLPSSAQEQAQRSAQEVEGEKVGGKGDLFPATDLHIQTPIFLSGGGNSHHSCSRLNYKFVPASFFPRLRKWHLQSPRNPGHL